VPTWVPHSSQKRACGRSAFPHAAQAAASGAPHSSQNLLPMRFSAPQLWQFTTSL
jgi:hypothetical protein